MAEIQETITKVAKKEKATSTLEAYGTSVSKFFDLITTIQIPVSELYERTVRNNEEDQMYLMGLLTAYLADVQKTQKKSTTCKDYAQQVKLWWKKVVKTTLWSDDMMDNTSGFVHSLTKTKRFYSAERFCIYSADILVMLGTVQMWVSAKRSINDRGARCRKEVWSSQIYNLLAAQYSFVSGNTFRFGESDDPGDADFDFMERITYADVKIHVRKSDGVRIMTIRDPARKVTNSKSGKPITMTFNSDPLNWPTLVERLMLAHPVHPAHASQTPLFRDPRGLVMRGGFYPHSTKVLTSALSLSLMRKLIEANPQHFKERLDAQGKASGFGLHSFKIGHFNEMLDKGTSELDARASGRWDGSSFRKYHRLSNEKEHEISRAAANGTAAPRLP